MPNRGVLIAVEGMDCSGKTTACKRLCTEFGYAYIKLPDRETPIGQIIAKYLRGDIKFVDEHKSNERVAQMLFAAGNLCASQEILRHLRAGKTVVVDRYLPSAVVYHSHAVGSDQKKFVEIINEGMPLPDVTIVLEVDPHVAKRRRTDYGQERFDDVDTQLSIRQLYRKHFPDAEFIDANQSADDVYEKLKRVDAVVIKVDTCNEAIMSRILDVFTEKRPKTVITVTVIVAPDTSIVFQLALNSNVSLLRAKLNQFYQTNDCLRLIRNNKLLLDTRILEDEDKIALVKVEDPIRIKVMTVQQGDFTVHVDIQETLGMLKTLLSQMFDVFAVQRQVLKFGEKILDDDKKLLSEYGIRQNDYLELNIA